MTYIIMYNYVVHKKKKKKHSHHRGDQAKVANLQRFSSMISGLFDQQMSDGMSTIGAKYICTYV